MLTGLAGWSVAMTGILIVWIVILIRKGPAEALGPAMLLSFALPVWVRVEFSGMPFNLRTSTAIITLLVFAVHPRGKILSPLTLLDFCIAFICCSHILTDTHHAGVSVQLPFRAYGEWALPYVAGRYAVRNQQDVQVLSRWATGVLCVLALLAVVETVTRINPFEVLFGERPEELANRKMTRFGLKRAYAVAMHPIYFGMLMAVLAPWLIVLGEQRDRSTRNLIRGLVAAVVLTGLLATLSRTPVATFLGTGILLAVMAFRVLRVPVALLAALALAAIMLRPEQVADATSLLSGERTRVVELDGQATVYSSSRARLLILKTYSRAMWHAGILGFGTEATMTFPPKIPYLEGTAETRDSLKLVDNGYIVTILRFGWMGGILLLLLLLTGIGSALSLYHDRPDRLFSAAVAAMLTGYTFLSLMLVSQVYDFALPMLWMLGIVSGLCSQRTASRLQRTTNWRTL